MLGEGPGELFHTNLGRPCSLHGDRFVQRGINSNILNNCAFVAQFGEEPHTGVVVRYPQTFVHKVHLQHYGLDLPKCV